MAIERLVNIVVNEIGMDSAIESTQRLQTGLNNVEESSTNLAGGMRESSNSVLENGGAMGLLNDATGGLAMTVKDAVEATALFAKESKISTFIQGAYATVVGTSTGAMKAFKVALISTGIGALVVGLILLITNFGKVKDAVFNLIPGLKSVGDFIGTIVNSVTDFIGVTSEAERALERLSAKADAELKAMDKSLKENGSAYSESAKKKMAIDKQLLEDLKTGLYNEQKLRKEAQIAKDNIDKENAIKAQEKRKAEQDKVNQENKRIADKAKQDKEKQKAIDDKIAEDRKKLAEENLKEQNEFQIKVNNAQFEQKLIDEQNQRDRLDAITAVTDELDRKELERKKGIIDAEIQFQIDKDNAIANSKENLNNIIQGLESSGLAKTKAGQIASKAIALTQIAIDSAVAISKASTLANAEGVAAQLAFPTVPGIGTVARIVSYASTAASVIGNIATAKRMLSSGGGSASVSPSGGGGAQSSAPPQFNIVGQNSNNQLAQTIGTQQNRPIEAFVVSGNVTNAQQLDRNRINTATFGS